MKRQYSDLFDRLDKHHKNASIGLFTNQVAFDFMEKKYLAELISESARLDVLFLPEHGFFSELQDQVHVEDRQSYPFIKEKTRVLSLYRNNEKGFANDRLIENLDLVIIEIQDIGSRYYTYVTTLAQLLYLVNKSTKKPSLILIDHPNIAGRQVEGTLLPDNYASLIGWKGIPHRYGLTLGELSLFVKDQIEADIDLEIIKFEKRGEDDILINPSPNIPQQRTLRVFTGQCLLEGTNISEGRGTTRPFEIFGAPFFNDIPDDWLQNWHRKNPEAVLRPLIFIPAFHKYKHQQCVGFQLHPQNENFHSLFYSLKLLRELKHILPHFTWLEGPYESGSEKSAIEILAGDKIILNYLNGDYDDNKLNTHLKTNEKDWIGKTEGFLLYDQPLYSN